jgi:lipopolysaccharide transport system ATP-binding protein
MVELCNVTKTYYRMGTKIGIKTYLMHALRGKVPPVKIQQALSGVSFSVRRGECVGLLGANGAGKSTVLGLIAGVLEPTSGQVLVQGRVAPLLELGAGFNRELTAKENLLINAVLLGLTRREAKRKMEEILDFAGLGAVEDEPLYTFSTGMQVRLGFSIAVHIDPDILLVDEVLAVGDEEFQQKCLDKVDEMHKRGITLLLVTHQMQDVARVCDRALLLSGGKICLDGEADTVIAAYRKMAREHLK